MYPAPTINRTPAERASESSASNSRVSAMSSVVVTTAAPASKALRTSEACEPAVVAATTTSVPSGMDEPFPAVTAEPRDGRI